MMLRYVRLLLGARVRLFYNNFRRGRLGAKIGWIVAGLGLLGMAALSALGGYALTRLVETLQNPEVLELLRENGFQFASLDPDLFLRSLLSTLVLATWAMIIMSSLGAALSNFYLSSDLDLLIAAPIPVRAIFTAKFLEGLGLAYLLLFVLGGPALVGLGIGSNFPAVYFVGALLVLLLVPLIPQALGTLLVMPLVRVVPPKRLREVLQVLGGLIGTAFYFFSQLPRTQDIDPETAGKLVRLLLRTNLPFLPHAWAAQGLLSLGARRYLEAGLALGAFLLLSLLLYGLCLVVAERLYLTGWAGLQTAPSTSRSRRTRRERGPARSPQDGEAGVSGAGLARTRPAREIPLLSQQIQGIIAKDLRLLLRDPQSWSQLLMPLAVYALFLFQNVRTSAEIEADLSTVLPLVNSAMVLFLSSSMVSRLSLGGIGSERQQIWLIKGAPVSPRNILWAKFISAYVPFLGLSGLLLAVMAFFSRAGWALALGSWLLQALIGLGVNGFAVGLGASFPNLQGQKPQQVVSTGAGCAYFPVVMVYAIVVAACLLLPPLASTFLTQHGLNVLAWLLWALGPLGAVVLTALALWLPLHLGARRLARLEV